MIYTYDTIILKEGERVDAAEIKALRKTLGLSQERFARTVGVTLVTVRRWEQGHSKPSYLAMGNLEQLKRELESKQLPEDIVPGKGELVIPKRSGGVSSFAQAHIDLDLDAWVQKHRPGCILDWAIVEPYSEDYFEITRIKVKPKGS